jgi:hypothetical protein
MTNQEFLDKLRTLVVDYDKDHREYPESEFEGLAFYCHTLYALGIEDDSRNIEDQYPEIYKRNLHYYD